MGRGVRGIGGGCSVMFFGSPWTLKKKTWFRNSAEYRLQKQIKIFKNVKHKEKRRRVEGTKLKQVAISAYVDVYIKRMEKWLPCLHLCLALFT